jgi:hypothetical protein
VTIFFGCLHELLQLKIKLVQAKLDLCICDTVAVTVDIKKFPEEEMLISQLVEHPDVIVFYPVRCTVEETPSSRDHSRKDVTQHGGRGHIDHEDPVIAYANTAGEKCNSYPVNTCSAKDSINQY